MLKIMVFRQYYHFLLNPLTLIAFPCYCYHECIFVANSLIMDNPELHCAIRNAYTTSSGNLQIFRCTSVCLCRRSFDCHFLKFGCLWVLTVTPRKYWNYSYTASPDCRRDKVQYKYSCLIT